MRLDLTRTPRGFAPRGPRIAVRLATLREGVLLALDQLRANKFRTFLTILGVVVGVATVMAMSAVIAGIRTAVLAELEAIGPRNFAVVRWDITNVRLTDQHGPPWGDNPKITVEEARRLDALPAVRRAVIAIDHAGRVEGGREGADNVQVLLRDYGWDDFTSGQLLVGQHFQPEDVRTSRPVAVLSVPLAELLFGRLDPISRQIRIQGRAFRVMGVFDVTGNPFATIARHFAIIPYTAGLKYLDVWDGLLGVALVTADRYTQEQAVDQAITAMRTARSLRPGDPNDFEVVRQQAMVQAFNKVTAMFFVVMLALSSVGLMVGGVGVIAIMMIAVTERTREIGIRKALGATGRQILWQFLVESATLTVAGGAIGMLVGAGAAFAVAALTPIPARVPFLAVVAALAMAAIAGVVFGMWPAWRAARLDPVAALRYE